MNRAKRSKGNPNWIKGGASPNPSGRASNTDSEPQSLQDRINTRLDAWFNNKTGLGIRGRDKTVGTCFELDVIDAESALDVWRGDPIAARLVEVPPNECLRQGYDLCIGDDDPPPTFKPPEPPAPGATTQPQPGKGVTAPPKGKPPAATKMDAMRTYARKHPSAFARKVRAAIARQHMDAGDAKPLQEAITKKLQDLGTNAILKEAMCYERAGGGAAVLLGANDFTTDLRIPLDLKKVRSLDYLTPLEAREIIPLYYYNDPRAPKFGQCAIYQLVPYVVGAPVDNTYSPRVTQIHESRMLIFPGIRCTRRLIQTSANGWGDNIFTRVMRALRGFNMGHQSAETLLSDFAQAVYKIKGLAALISKNPNALMDSMMNVELSRSIVNAVVIDGEEEFERKSTSLAGYSDLLGSFALNLAAAGDMPMTLLMGMSPAGMNATGASDIRFFYDRIASMQTMRVGPMIMRLVEILLWTMHQDPAKINHSVRFKSLWQPTEKEIAEAHFTQAQADAIYITNDVASAEEIALSRFGGDQFSYETFIDFEARADQEAIVAPTVEAKPNLQGGPVPDNAFNYSPDPAEKGPMPSASQKPGSETGSRAPSQGSDS